MFVDIWQSEIDIDEVFVPMVGELKSRIAKGAAVTVSSDPVKIFRIQSKDEDRELGHALILDEVGKYRPITFLVALDSKDRVLDLQVLVYREHIGKAIESKRFTRQFRNKSGTSQLKLHRDIRNLAGATLSARASVRAVRRALATIDETVRTGMALDWHRNLSNDLLANMNGIAEVEVDLEKETSDSMPKPVTRARPAMGTILRIEAYGENAAIGIAAAFDEVERIEALLSRWKSDSDVIRVESAPIGTPVFVSSTTLECVQLALSAARESGGAFDPTLVSQGYQKVLVDMDASTITLGSENLILDLGGIGKGYALDRAAKILEEHDVHSVLLDFGGQLLALDPPPEQSGWDVGIFDPRNTGTLLGSLPLVRASLATSSDYERGDHIVDPLLGKVAEVSLSTTILAQNATRADSMSTTLAVLGPEHAQRLIDKVAGGAAVILVAGEDSPRILGDLPH
jgi:thiamine biosynthesis lipoprotein ApbE